MDMVITEKMVAETLAASNEPAEFRRRREALRKQLDEIDAVINAEADAAKAATITSIRAMMSSHGITLAELDDKPKPAPKKRERKSKAARQPGTYTHPDGRTHVEVAGKKGRRPVWLNDAGVTVTA